MRSFLLRWTPSIYLGLITLLLFQTVLLIGIVPSASMEPLVGAGSFILADRTAYWWNAPVPGEVVVFERNGRLLVKRIAAVGGQAVPLLGQKAIVPEGCLYVLGDNQAASVDSEDWQDPFVSIEDVKGKLLLPVG